MEESNDAEFNDYQEGNPRNTLTQKLGSINNVNKEYLLVNKTASMKNVIVNRSRDDFLQDKLIEVGSVQQEEDYSF